MDTGQNLVITQAVKVRLISRKLKVLPFEFSIKKFNIFNFRIDWAIVKKRGREKVADSKGLCGLKIRYHNDTLLTPLWEMFSLI